MTPLARLLHRALERLLGRWREGPRTPARLVLTVEDFAAYHPGATREEWMLFAAKSIDGAYRAGYARGFEADARFGFGGRHPSPEFLADLEEGEGWRDSPPIRFYR